MPFWLSEQAPAELQDEEERLGLLDEEQPPVPMRSTRGPYQMLLVTAVLGLAGGSCFLMWSSSQSNQSNQGPADNAHVVELFDTPSNPYAPGNPCAPAVPTSTTAPPNCEDDVKLDFGRASLMANNLNGKGPGTGREEDMRFAHLGEHEGKSFDLVVTSANFEYPGNPDPVYNGLLTWWPPEGMPPNANKAKGLISAKRGPGNESQPVELKFKIVEEGTDVPLTLPKFYFTFLDIDTDGGGLVKTPGEEKVTASGFAQYIVTPNTDIVVSTDGAKTSFTGSKWNGDDSNNPVAKWTNLDVAALDASDSNKAVTLVFLNTAEFTVSFTASQGYAPDFSGVHDPHYDVALLFAGKSQLAFLPCQR